MYKILALNCLMTAYSESVLALKGIKFSDYQSTIMGFAISIFFLMLSRAVPLKKVNSNHAPLTIFTWPAIISIIGQAIADLSAMILILYITEKIDPLSIGQEKSLDEKFSPTLINSIMFLFQMLNQTITFIVNYQGEPFMENLSTNGAMRKLIMGILAFSAVFIFDLFPQLNENLELVPLPDDSGYRMSLIFIMVTNFIICYLLEKWKNILGLYEPYPKSKPNTKECTDNMFVEDIIEDISLITKNGIEVSKEEDIKYYNDVLKNIEKGFTSLKYDRSNIEKGQDEVIKTGKVTVTLTTSENQKNNVNNNMTTIDIGECENLLRQFYHIPSDEKLYMKIMGIVQDGMNAIKVEYDIYCKLNGTNLIKLNLTVCKETTVTIRIPFEINDHIDKLNTSSGYYNDICYTTTSEDGTDISMKDRKNDFANQDRIVCQEDCIFSEYDYDNHVAKCKCNVKESPPSIADMKIDKEKLLANFKDIKSFANFNFLVCHKKLFTKEGIKNNYGCYLMSIIILFHILSIFIFILNNFHLIKKQIIDIASKINKNQSTSIKEVKKNSKLDDKEIFIFKAKKEKNKENINFDKKKLIKNKKTKINEAKKPATKDSSKNRIINKNKINNNLIKNKTINNLKIQTKKLKDKINPINIINQKAKIGIKENFNDYIDEEINGLPYVIAIKYDKRNYCQYYGSLIKTQHNLICAFCNNNDYNCSIIKINLFFIGFTIEYTINALFYNDDNNA